MRTKPFLYISVALLLMLQMAVPAAAQKQVLRPEGFEPKFPYSPGVVAGDLVFVAGQGSRDKSGQHPATFEDQVRQSIENVRTVLKAGGMDLSHAVSCHVYLDDLENYGRMNKVYGTLFTEAPPVRTTIAVPKLPDDNKVEITCVAAKDKAAKQSVYRSGKPPARPGLFPNGMRIGDWLFTSGVGSRNPETGQHPEGFEAQTRQVMDSLGAILKAGGADFSNVVWANLYIDRPEDAAALKKVYESYFPGRKPGSTTSIVARIPGDSHVEITLLAAMPPAQVKAAGATGVLAGKTLFVSAQSAAGSTIEEQVKGTFEKLKKALAAGGMTFADVAKAHVYLKDMAEFPKMNAVYRTYFAKDPPARTTVQVTQPGSSADALVEISFVAAK